MHQKFATRLLEWFDVHGRHDLPWQKNRTLYRVWVAEIMLQQTQVTSVIPYYQRFMRRFRNLKQLAGAEQEEVLQYWAGLGYYSRARNLHKAATILMRQSGGRMPRTLEALVALPGIGRSTAAAILSQSLDVRHTILDGNVKRVLARFDAVPGWPGSRETEQRLWQLAEQYTPDSRNCDYTQAIMDLGATLCTRSRPDCVSCPVSADCDAYQAESVSQYPAKKPKQDKPVKRSRFLILTDAEGAVLLEKRPPSGIWGGLWSLPEAEPEQDVVELCRSRWGLEVTHCLNRDGFRHSFSHYHLEILPCACRIKLSSECVQEQAGIMWYRHQDDLPAVATPVSRLLTEYALAD